MSLRHGPKPSALSAPDRTSDPKVDPVQTAASQAACAGITPDAPLAAEVPEGVDLFEIPRVKLEQELEEDLRQDLEDLQQKRWAVAQDAKEEQLRLAAYLEKLFRERLIDELDALIKFLSQKLRALPSASSGLRAWDNHQAERSYLGGLLIEALAKLEKLGGA